MRCRVMHPSQCCRATVLVLELPLVESTLSILAVLRLIPLGGVIKNHANSLGARGVGVTVDSCFVPSVPGWVHCV